MNTDYEELEQLPEDDPLLDDLPDTGDFLEPLPGAKMGAKGVKACTGKLLMLRKALKKGE